MSSRMRGGSLLQGNNTVPGVSPPKEVMDLVPDILQVCKDFGLDFWPTVVQFLDYDEISEVAAYSGFPVRYPHWKWGMDYEELSKGYEYGMHRIYEMVINSRPTYIYCLNSNTLVDNITVIVHATGHNDFFKNNIRFKPTQCDSINMMNELANNGTRIRKYMSRWGKEKVTEFLDYVLRLDTLVDPAAAWRPPKISDLHLKDSRRYVEPRRINVPEGKDYMEEWINPKKFKDRERERAKRKEAADEIGVFKKPSKDILGFLRDHAPLKTWQADIVAMLYNEAQYFAPQRITKMINEGWASYVDYQIMAGQGLASMGQEPGSGIIEYANHKAGVLGGKYSLNPYKLGFHLFLDIEERWNKGKFGEEYDNCANIKEREDWDKKLGLGKEKVFDVRKYYDDVMMIHEFFTPDFCTENEFFEWERRPNGEYVITEKDPKVIKERMMQKFINGGLPDIRLVDPNHRNKGIMLLQHFWDGRILHESYTRETLIAIYKLWQRPVILATRNLEGDEEVYCCEGMDSEAITKMDREEYESKPLWTLPPSE